jgi:hypothetical protein
MIELGLYRDRASGEDVYRTAEIFETELQASDARFEFDGFVLFGCRGVDRRNCDATATIHKGQS